MSVAREDNDVMIDGAVIKSAHCEVEVQDRT